MSRSLPAYSPITDRVLAAFAESPYRFLDAPQVRHLARTSDRCARDHIKVLIARGYLRPTAYRGSWAITPAGHRRHRDVREGSWLPA